MNTGRDVTMGVSIEGGSVRSKEPAAVEPLGRELITRLLGRALHKTDSINLRFLLAYISIWPF